MESPVSGGISGKDDSLELAQTSNDVLHRVGKRPQERGSKVEEAGIEPAQPLTPPPPPNSGLVAWIQCAGTFCLWFAAWGLVNSFGVFQAYYETRLPHTSSSNISWIGSIQLCIFIGGTSVVGPVYDIGYLRTLLTIGTALTFFGMMMTSLGAVYWHFMLAQGVAMGLGMTCLFVPCVAVLPPYFSSRRALAMGLAASGSSFGAIVFTIMFQKLLPLVDFGWTTRCIGFVLLAMLVLPVTTMQKRVPQSPRRALIDFAALRELPFGLVLCSMFVVFAGLYVPYFYIEVFSVRAGVLVHNELYLSKYLIIYMNAGSLFGRVLPNILADRVGAWNTYILVCIITGAIGFCWIAVSRLPGLITFCVLYGFFSGSFVALTPLIWALLSPNPQIMGTRIGMMTVPMAAGLLVGNPIAGVLVHGNSFVNLQIFCGSTVVAAGLLLSVGRLAQGRSILGWKT